MGMYSRFFIWYMYVVLTIMKFFGNFGLGINLLLVVCFFYKWDKSKKDVWYIYFINYLLFFCCLLVNSDVILYYVLYVS